MIKLRKILALLFLGSINMSFAHGMNIKDEEIVDTSDNDEKVELNFTDPELLANKLYNDLAVINKNLVKELKEGWHFGMLDTTEQNHVMSQFDLPGKCFSITCSLIEVQKILNECELLRKTSSYGNLYLAIVCLQTFLSNTLEKMNEKARTAYFSLVYEGTSLKNKADEDMARTKKYIKKLGIELY